MEETPQGRAAKRGNKEEDNIVNMLNTDTAFKNKVGSIVSELSFNECIKIGGDQTKADITSKDGVVKIQVKETQNDETFQHLDRHYLNILLENIPGLEPLRNILEKLFEKPLKPEQYTHVNTAHKVKKLDTSNYTDNELSDTLNILNRHKSDILNYACYGTTSNNIPNILITVFNKKSGEKEIRIYKYSDVLTYLNTLDFEIAPKKTSFRLGNGVIQMMRKGGEKGKKGSNQVQFKITPSKIKDKVLNELITI